MLPKLVYVGCGHHRMKGFIHVEISIAKDKSGPPDILTDITEKIPLPGNSVDLIFSRATLEHLTYRELVNHLLECRRILKKGGCIRMLVPDFDIFINNYNNKIYWNDFEKDPDFPNENYVDTFVALTYYHDHYYLHNFNTLERALKKTGFTKVREAEPGDTKIEQAREEVFKAEITRYDEIIIEAEKSSQEPTLERYIINKPRNFINIILAKFFNIKLVAINKRKPVFSTRRWFKEKWYLLKNRNLADYKTEHKTGIGGVKFSQPKYEHLIDLSLPVGKGKLINIK
ncbi:MAG: methyltransferase domain-containing protein [Patescibacteria group bacterium]